MSPSVSLELTGRQIAELLDLIECRLSTLRVVDREDVLVDMALRGARHELAGARIRLLMKTRQEAERPAVPENGEGRVRRLIDEMRDGGNAGLQNGS